jgi:methionyl-tRNA formyltransferase
VRVVFLGTPAFAVPTLDALVEAGHEVCAVVAQPDRPSGRGQQVVSPATVLRARALGIPTLQPLKVKSGEFPEAFEALAADVAVVVAYGRILTPRLLAAPRRGCVNVHASLLPRWRGAAPIQWSILGGDDVTGISTMEMAEGLDTGDVLLREETPIGEEETAPELHDRLAPMGARLLVRTLAEWPASTPQDPTAATYAPMLDRAQGALRWADPAASVHRTIRGLAGWPGTHARFRGEPMKVLRARRVDGEGSAGEVLGGAVIACGTGAIELLEVQLPGRKAVRGTDWVNGMRVQPGERLGDGQP